MQNPKILPQPYFIDSHLGPYSELGYGSRSRSACVFSYVQCTLARISSDQDLSKVQIMGPVSEFKIIPLDKYDSENNLRSRSQHHENTDASCW